MIDTTGASLFKRGYRVEKGGAPIKENMAAAIIELSNWYPDKPLSTQHVVREPSVSRRL